jgi:hypothetical protein
VLARFVFSRTTKIAFSLLILGIAALLVFSLISGSGSNVGSQAPVTKSSLTAPPRNTVQPQRLRLRLQKRPQKPCASGRCADPALLVARGDPEG